MKTIKPDSIKPIHKMHIEDNEYIIIMEYTTTDEFKGRTIEKTYKENRFCKANKKGDITINFAGSKIKSNVNLIPGGE